MIKSSLLALAVVLASVPASAGPFMHMLKAKQAADAARAAAAVPALPRAEAPSLTPPAMPAEAAQVSAAAASPVPPLDPESSFYPVEAARNAALQNLADAGARDILKQAGLMLWRFNHRSSGPDEAYALTVSFFDGGSAAALDDYVRQRSPALRAQLAGALGVGVDDVEVRARSSDSCCGSGCGSCLRSKDNASPYWTGRPPHRREDR